MMIQRPYGVAAALLLTLFGSAPATAQVTNTEYAARRQHVTNAIGGGVLLVTGAAEPRFDYMSFYQDPHFDYLTGIREAGAALVVVRRDGVARSWLFVEPRDPAQEVWSGFRLGTSGAEARSGIPARLISELPVLLDSLVRPADTLWVAGPEREDLPLAQFIEGHPEVVSRRADRVILSARAFKSDAEIALLRQAIDITVLAHNEAIRMVRPGLNEFEVQALIEYTFRRNGADRPSFASIVGSGPNATTLHYNANDRFMRAGEMLVMDIGASYRGYAADVTRSVPISGTFTDDQRAVYTVVREAQKAAERQVAAGTSWRTVSDSATAVIAAGLASIGLVDSAHATYDCGRNRECSQVQLYYMHGLGHGIGLEVHDPDRHEVTGTLDVGSIFTLEPGIYVRGNLLDIVPDTPTNASLRARLQRLLPRFANTGVRIEDDYLLGPDGLEWLSRGVPREMDEIEALMRGDHAGPAARDSSLVERYRRVAP